MYISPITPITTNFKSQHNDTDKKQSIRNRFKSVLVGSMIALSSLSPMSAEANNINSINNDDEVETMTVNFNDDNGILESTDFEYSSQKAKKLSASYLDGLKPYMGKKCTQAVADMANNLAYVFNVSNNYYYDFVTDELVKDTKSTIAYDRFGRVLATTIKYPSGDEETVSYKYYTNGNVDKAIYKNDKIIDYRKDGTRFSLETTDPFRQKEIIYYNQQGRMTNRSISGKNSLTELTYDDNENLLKHLCMNDEAGWQKIYNNGEMVLETFYDGKGRVLKYVDNYFEKKGEDIVVNGYLSSRTVHRGEPYNVLYKESPIDGKITSSVRQGTTGTCYAAGIINSLVRIPAGIQLLDKVLPSDLDRSKCVVDFRGLNVSYTIPERVVSHHMSRLGRRDADYAGMIMAYEKFRESDMLYDENIKLPECFYKDNRGEGDRRVDSGTPKEFFYALSGQLMDESGDKITDSDIMKARRCLETGRGIVNAGTILKENKNDEIPLVDRSFGVMPKHNVSIVAINDRNVTIYDSVSEKETSYPISKFKKYFSKMYWATLD